MVSEVDVGLPCRQGLVADLGLGEHDLQTFAIGSLGEPILEAGKAEFAGIAGKHYPPGDPHKVFSFFPSG